MNPILHRHATPITLGLFGISAISGTALFFHVWQGAFHEMHEWLSMLLLLPFALHIWKNWAALTGYARRRTLLVPVAASLLAALLFAAPAMTGASQLSPSARAMRAMTEARLTDLAPVLKTTPDALANSLRQRGFTVQGGDDTPRQVAAAAHVQVNQVMLALLPNR